MCVYTCENEGQYGKRMCEVWEGNDYVCVSVCCVCVAWVGVDGWVCRVGVQGGYAGWICVDGGWVWM